MTMRLQQKHSRELLIRLSLAMLVGAILLYTVLLTHSSHMLHKQLMLSQQNVWYSFIHSNGQFTRAIGAEYRLDDGNSLKPSDVGKIRDTILYDSALGAYRPFAALTREYSNRGASYGLTTFVSSTEVEHLVIKVTITEIVILLLFFISAVFINSRAAVAIWRPFSETLTRISEYDVTKNEVLALPEDTSIIEFNELNTTLNRLVAKSNSAYYNQKQFVENASHEIQTPLSVIRNKLELLINENGINHRIARLIDDISEANERLSQMNKNLLLLARIDNNQFPSTEQVNMTNLIVQVLSTYENLYENRMPSVMKTLTPNVIIAINPALAEILLSNLIKNAIVHNKEQGSIIIDLNGEFLMIRNTGDELHLPTDQLFERFKKANDESRSTGLGLALVRQICQLYDLEISYHYGNSIHSLKLRFRNSIS